MTLGALVLLKLLKHGSKFIFLKGERFDGYGHIVIII